jgi:hypothetical protein
MKQLCLMLSLLLLTQVNGNSVELNQAELHYYKAKLNLDQLAFDIKIKKEEQEIINSKKTDFQFFNAIESILDAKNFSSVDLSCVEWVYKGPGSRQDALEACKGVRNMTCVEWVYKGPGTRMEAARACRSVPLQQCVEWVYKGPGTRMEAAQSCRGVKDMECVEFIYRGTGTRMEAAKACAESRGRPDDNC